MRFRRQNLHPEGLSRRVVGGHLLYSPVVTLADLVRTTTYVTDIDEFFRHVEVRQRYFGGALPR